MSHRWNIKNTVNGLLFTTPPLGEKGHVRKAKCWEIPVRVDSHSLNRNSLIKFINSRLEPMEPKLRKGILGPSNKKLRTLLQNVLKEPIINKPNDEGTPPVTVIKGVTDQKEGAFIDKLSSRQLALFHSLSRSIEKEMYEQLYSLGESEQYPGILADVLLSLLKGRVTGFQVRGNEISMDLLKGHGMKKLLGFDLKGTFPERLILRYHPEMKKLSFINCKIPFHYPSFFNAYILNPECLALTPQGLRIQADFGSMPKKLGEDKRLDKPLSSNEVFKIFE
jgi:hypothetical protein